MSLMILELNTSKHNYQKLVNILKIHYEIEFDWEGSLYYAVTF